MKDEWYADKRDLVKWSVLVHLANRHRAERILQVAYYRPSVWPEVEIDGQRYAVPESVIEHFRSILQVSRLTVGCKIDVVDALFGDRAAYEGVVAETIAKHQGGTQLVFLDPDTGLAPSKPDLAHVLESELVAVWKALGPGDLLVFYQHQTNRNGQPWVEPKRRQFEVALGLAEGAARVAVAPKIARDVAFFFAAKS